MKTNLLILLLLCSSAFGQWRISDWGPNGKPMLGTPLLWQDGLVGSWLFNEGVGGTVYDTSGYGNAGTIVGANWSSGIHGPTLDIAGDGTDYINADVLASTVASNTTGTVVLWQRCEDNTVNANSWIGISDGGDSNSYLLLKVSNTSANGEIEGNLREGGSIQWKFNYNADGTIIQNNIWYHIALTVGANGISLYVDGIKQTIPAGDYSNGSAASTEWISSITNIDAIRIGGLRISSSEFAAFNGQIDSPQIYNRDLTASEVQRLYMDSFWQYRAEPLWSLEAVAGGSAAQVIMIGM